jgi:hypothetical protein
VGTDRKIKEQVTIKDLSNTGVKFISENAKSLKVGESLRIEFMLDDANQSLIDDEIIVRNISGFTVGAQFFFRGYSGKAIGFYLMK